MTARYENDAIYIPSYDAYEQKICEHCDHSPMLKTAQFTSYRLIHSSPIKRASWTNTYHVRKLHASTRYYQGTNLREEAPKPNVDHYKMTGNRDNRRPKHEMVHFRGLLNTQRRFGDFRTVLHTGLYSQLVAMEVPVNGEIGDEVHTVDQILLFTSGRGLATVAGKDQEVQAGDVVIVPAGTQHQFVTRGDQPLELITVYSPAEHMVNTVHKTKEQGDKEEDEGKDEAPEWSRTSKKENEDQGLVRLSGRYDGE